MKNMLVAPKPFEATFDASFNHALEIIRMWRVVPTLQDAVAYLRSKPPSFETIIVLASLAPLVSKTEQTVAAQKQRKGSRTSRYAAQHDKWMIAARASTLNCDLTKASRQRAAVKAIMAAGTRASRRTVSAFVTTHWAEIEGHRAKVDRWNMPA